MWSPAVGPLRWSLAVVSRSTNVSSRDLKIGADLAVVSRCGLPLWSPAVVTRCSVPLWVPDVVFRCGLLLWVPAVKSLPHLQDPPKPLLDWIAESGNGEAGIDWILPTRNLDIIEEAHSTL